MDSCLKRLKHEDSYDLAVGGSRHHILNSRSYSPSELFCFDPRERIAGYQPVMFIRKDYALKSRIHEITRNAFESGLFAKWSRDSQRKRERIFSEEENLSVTLEDYYVALIMILGIGLSAATLIFFWEHFVQQQVQKKPRSPWTCLRNTLDGHRHYLTDIPENLQNGLSIKDFIVSNRTYYWDIITLLWDFLWCN